MHISFVVDFLKKHTFISIETKTIFFLLFDGIVSNVQLTIFFFFVILLFFLKWMLCLFRCQCIWTTYSVSRHFLLCTHRFNQQRRTEWITCFYSCLTVKLFSFNFIKRFGHLFWYPRITRLIGFWKNQLLINWKLALN